MKPFIRDPYNYDVKAASDECASLHEPGISLTVQAMAEDADLNVLMKRFGITGKMPENVHIPQYGDFEHVMDFRTAHDAIIEARESFMTIPADIRSRFSNDPQMFLEFCSDPANLPEMRRLGFAIPEPPL